MESKTNAYHHRWYASAILQGTPQEPVSDQWLPPFVITDGSGAAVGTVEDNDAVVIYNFRADRVVEISKAFEYEDFNHFDRTRFPKVTSAITQLPSLSGHPH